jgi:hypothetical protein
MNARSARGDNHPVGKRRPAREIYGDDVFGFGVIESFKDNLRQDIGRSRAPGSDRADGGVARRQVQRRIPLWAGSIRIGIARNMRLRSAHFKLTI